jgi:hypothetical protein
VGSNQYERSVVFQEGPLGLILGRSVSKGSTATGSASDGGQTMIVDFKSNPDGTPGPAERLVVTVIHRYLVLLVRQVEDQWGQLPH